MPEHEESQSEKSNQGNSSQKLSNEDLLKFGPLGKSILQSLPIGVAVFDADLKIIESNPRAAELIELCDTINESLAKGTDNPDRPGLDWTRQLKSATSTGKILKFDAINYTRDNKTKLLQIVCTSLKDTEMHSTTLTTGGIVIIEDITEKVNTQRQLANAERLAAIGKLASKVAHELNNPMDGILRYINLAIRIVEQENLEKPKEYLAQCRQGLMRMVHIVSDLLEFTRSTYTSMEYTKMEHIIEDALKTMAKEAEALNVRIMRNYAPDTPRIKNGNLFQVFCNLTKNALDAMPGGGELNVSTRLAADNTIVAEFHDSGSGLPSTNVDIVFEPFFTTKGKGTGLGLAICKDIVERYQGRITAEKAPQGGSIFTVYLPLGGNKELNP